MYPTWEQASGTSNVSYSSWLAQSVYSASREDDTGAAGVRVPRRPIQPIDTSGAALDLPHVEDAPPQYVWTV